MIVSALVVTLPLDPSLHAAELAALASWPELSLGEPIGNRVPVVAETESLAAGAALCDALAARVGVLRVDVVAIDFDDPDPPMESTAQGQPRGLMGLGAQRRAEVL